MDGPPTRITYSPPGGGAARRPSATIDKQHTSNRRFIVSGEEDYLCRARNSASGRARSPSTPNNRWASKRPGGGPLQVVATNLHPSHHARGHPTFGVFESARTYHREPVLLPGE